MQALVLISTNYWIFCHFSNVSGRNYVVADVKVSVIHVCILKATSVAKNRIS